MSRTNPVRPVRPARRPRAAAPAWDLEATRIARVDPRTGSEIPAPAPAPAPAAPAVDPDATVIGEVPASPAAGRPLTAEVIPPRDARPSSEVTAAWVEEPSRGSGRFAGRILRLPRRARIAAAAIPVVLAASVLALGRGAPDAPARPAPVRAPAPLPQAAPPAAGGVPEAPPSPRGPAVSAPGADPAELAARAAGALADGRLEEARALYVSLAASDPENRAWSLAMEILGGPERAR